MSAENAESVALAPRGVQVPASHYEFAKYDDRERWMSYWHQLRVVFESGARSVLEIGPGSGVFRTYLQTAGVDVKTLDLDATRKPDYVADITQLDATLPQGVQFDAVCAFQVLEHLPFSEFEKCLQGIAGRAKRNVFLSLPYRGWRVRFAFWFGDAQYTFGHKFRLPWKLPLCAEHYWEVNRDISARQVTAILAKYFDVGQHGLVPENPYHYLWQLTPKKA